jgi:hypothetical protein
MGKRGPAAGTGGRPRKSIDEKLLDGKKAKALKKEKLSASASEFPEPSEYLSSAQRMEIPLRAKEIYERVYEWLTQFGCEKLVTKDTVEFYSLCTARWIQCEEVVSKIGFIGKHPTTQLPIASPYVSISRDYLKQAISVWDRISAVVRENATGDYVATAPNVDVMELLLTGIK